VVTVHGILLQVLVDVMALVLELSLGQDPSLILDMVVIVVVLMVASNLGCEEKEYGKGGWIDTDSI
jgi:hypothetical protein